MPADWYEEERAKVLRGMEPIREKADARRSTKSPEGHQTIAPGESAKTSANVGLVVGVALAAFLGVLVIGGALVSKQKLDRPVQYVDEHGNPISKERAEAWLKLGIGPIGRLESKRLECNRAIAFDIDHPETNGRTSIQCVLEFRDMVDAKSGGSGCIEGPGSLMIRLSFAGVADQARGLAELSVRRRPESVLGVGRRALIRLHDPMPPAASRFNRSHPEPSHLS